jgi:hypothetical protein
MTTPNEAWAEATDRLAALALKLQLHTEEELARNGVSVRDLAEKLGAGISSAANAVADACADDASREDLRDAGSAIADAVRASMHELRRAVSTASHEGD